MNSITRRLHTGLCLALLLCFTGLAFGQDYRAKLQGVVEDASGSALAGARVTLRNVATGVEVTRQTNGEGLYIFDFVESGTYTVMVEATGFKKFEQRNILVQNRGDITVNARLEVGGVSEVITIQDTPVAVQFNSSSDTTTVGNEIISQIPLRGRNPYNVVTLDPTINGGENNNGENRPYHHAFANEFDAGGGTRNANEIQLNGVSLTSSYKTAYTPSVEAVQEVSFQKNAVDSEYGYSAGGVVTVNMKSGTNRFHGSGYYYNRNPRFNAFGDPTIPRVAGADETIYRGTDLKMYGGTIGGPIVKNKVFFFTSWEQWDDKRPITAKFTVPTALERRGDFSQSRIGNYGAALCGTGITNCARPIFDTFSSTGTSGARTAFAGNIIPANRFDPTAVKLFAELPLPNLTGVEPNWQGAKTENVAYWNLSNRVDWTINERWKTFVSYGYFRTDLQETPQDNTAGKLFPLSGSNRNGLTIAADTVYTISSSKVLNIRANYRKLIDEFANEPNLLGKDGIAALWPNNPWYATLFSRDLVYYPAIDVPTGTTTNRLGRPGREWWQRPQGWGGSARMNWYAGNHNIKFGGDLRVDKGKGARFEPINLNFRAQNTAQNTSANINSSGNEWASFLIGALDNNSSGRRIPVQEVVTQGYSAYFQDDFKLNTRLTLNLGLRWEYEPGPVDRQNRLSQRIDLTSPIPEFQATPPNLSIRPAVTATNPNPLSALEMLATKGYKPIFNGAWIFTDENNRNAWSRQAANFLPRIGGAFRLDSKSVIRFGWSRYLSPSSKIRDALGDFVNQYTGFSTNTAVLPLLNGLPQARLSDPFPGTAAALSQGLAANALQLPTGKALGRYTNLGNAVSLDQYDLHPQNNDRFSLSYQREVWNRTIVSFDFFFNNGTNLPIDIDLNQADPNFLYELPRSRTNATVANPFLNGAGLGLDKFPGSLRNGATVTVASLLRPYPQYGAITQTNTALRDLHVMSYKAQAQRPFAQGFSMLVNYAYQTEEQTEFFDDRAMFARQLTWRPLPIAKHRFNHAITWEIPVGKGRRFLRDAPLGVNLALGGWQLTTTNRWYSGRQLVFSQNLRVSGSPKIDNPTFGRWFDTSVFSALPFPTDATELAKTPVNLARTNPWTYDGLVGPGTGQVDATLSKAFRIREGWKAEFRVETYNAFNQINWDNPALDFNNTATFGKVLNKRPGYIGREIQYGFKLTF